MASHQFKTSMTISIAHGSETELDLLIQYSVSPGSPESGRFGPPENYDPGSDDELEIGEIAIRQGEETNHIPAWLDGIIYHDTTLREAILSDWREREANAAPDGLPVFLILIGWRICCHDRHSHPRARAGA